MILTGVIINLAAIVLGSAAGLLLKKGIPDRMGESVLKAMALCVIYIGISGTLDGENILIAIISMAVGTIIGEALSLQQRLEQLGGFIQSKCRPSVGGVSVAEGFVSASLLFCIGAMAIVGSLQSGLSLDHSTLTAKSLIDGISAIVLASSLFPLRGNHHSLRQIYRAVSYDLCHQRDDLRGVASDYRGRYQYAF